MSNLYPTSGFFKWRKAESRMRLTAVQVWGHNKPLPAGEGMSRISLSVSLLLAELTKTGSLYTESLSSRLQYPWPQPSANGSVQRCLSAAIVDKGSLMRFLAADKHYSLGVNIARRQSWKESQT
jgi:hypothetical protein